MVLRPLKYGEPSGAELLKVGTMCSYEVQLRTADEFAQALMTHVCIRRTKEVRQISAVLQQIDILPLHRCKTARATLSYLFRRFVSTIICPAVFP